MSIARQQFLTNLTGIREAIEFEPLAQGALGTTISPGIIVLRKGVLVASLVALESFIRDRTAEASRNLERWPRSFDDLPDRLRTAARLEALTYLQKFARVLKRQGEDHEGELRSEITKMATGHGTVLQLTRFVAGDFTGNLSVDSLGTLLRAFQVHNHWESFRQFAANTGFGIPSVEEVVKNIVRWRHQSAHSAGYMPNATDIADLDTELLCVAMCFDVAISAALEAAVASPDQWLSDQYNWRDSVRLYWVRQVGTKTKITRYGRQRALAVADTLQQARQRIPATPRGDVSVLVSLNPSGLPISWELF